MSGIVAGHSWIVEYAQRNAKLIDEAGYAGDPLFRTAAKIAIEGGEALDAFMRLAGMARRTGTTEELEAEVADTVLSCYVFAARAGFDLDAAVARKLQVIYARGWRAQSDG